MRLGVFAGIIHILVYEFQGEDDVCMRLLLQYRGTRLMVCNMPVYV